MDHSYSEVLTPTPAAPPAKTTTELAQERTDLAVERTRIAHERTLMAWVRTSTSMITFGFTIYKFFQELVEKTPHHRHILSPRDLALALIGVGTLALLLAMWQHQQDMKELKTMGGKKRFSISFAVAALIALLGFVALGAVFVRA